MRIEDISLFKALANGGPKAPGMPEASDLVTERDNDTQSKPAPNSTRRLSNLLHSAYYPELLNTLGKICFISVTKSLKETPQLQLSAINTVDLKIPQTQTKTKRQIEYLPSLASAWMINNQGAYYKQLNTAFNILESHKENNNGFLLSLETHNEHSDSSSITKKTHKVLKNIEKMLLIAIKHLGFHEVSGAKYAALAVYGEANNNFHDFALSSNNDPKFEDFGNPKMRRCAEDSIRLLAKENKLDDKKLNYLFLMRGPYPEGYGDNNDGVFNFSKLVPCKSCLQHLEKLYEDGGNLIIVASLNQGKFLEESLNPSDTDQPQQKNYLLKDQERGDIRIIYPQGLKHCFIEIPNRNLPRIIVEKDIGTNVQTQGTECQNSRKVFTFGQWLEDQELIKEVKKIFTEDSRDLGKLITKQRAAKS